MDNMFVNAVLEQKDDQKAKHLSRFYKTGKGEYSENDVFLGLNVAQTRAVAKRFTDNYNVDEVFDILKSPYHEVRLGALFMALYKYKSADKKIKKRIYSLYLKNVDYINNWDLVDLSACDIVGDYVFNLGNTDELFRLAKTPHLWAQRISIVAGHYFIKQNKFDYTFEITKHFFNSRHDLIHKATGWMLREVGKKDVCALKKFLDDNAKYLPRTTLRYSIERFDEPVRKSYLAIKRVEC